MMDNLQCTMYLNGKRIIIKLDPLPDGTTIISYESLHDSQPISMKLKTIIQ